MKPLMESIAEGMENGMLPHVPEELSLEQSLFPAQLHPSHSATDLQAQLHAWAEYTLGPRYAQDVGRLRISLLACYFWPCTLDGRILTLLKLMYWLFLVEYALDEYEASSAEDKALQAEKLCSGVLEALAGAAAAADAPAEGPIAAAAASTEGPIAPAIAVALDWWAEMRQDGLSLNQQARFLAEVAKYLNSQKPEQMLMTEPAAAGLEAYIPLRRGTGAGGVFCMAVEYGLGIELDEEALGSGLLSQLHDAVMDHTIWINDIYSFPKELVKGECLNILYLLHARNNNNNNNSGTLVPFHVAISQAWQMLQEQQLACARLAQQIAASPVLASKPGLLRYVEALCLVPSGNWAWSMQATRFKPHGDAPLSTSHSCSPQACSLPSRPRTSIINIPFRGKAPSVPPSLSNNSLRLGGLLIRSSPMSLSSSTAAPSFTKSVISLNHLPQMASPSFHVRAAPHVCPSFVPCLGYPS